MIGPLTTPRELASYLGTSYSKLTYLVYGVGVPNLYKNSKIPKKSGGERIIRAPDQRLKIIQLRLKVLLEKLYKPHPAASAFIAERGIVYNAKKHTKKALVFNLDLANFYDSIHFGRIRGLLIAKPYSFQADTAQLIAHICCVDKVLPQGAPTSPVLSNMVASVLDRRLAHLAKMNNAYYSRYADDITFSFVRSDQNNIYTTTPTVAPHLDLERLISSAGFSINKSKTRLQARGERQVVTGLKVNAKVNVDRRYIRTTRAMIHSIAKCADHASKRYIDKFGVGSPRIEGVVQGRINFIGMVKGKDSSVFQTLATKYNSLNLHCKINTEPAERNDKLEQALHFRTYNEKSRLESCVWVVDFDGLADCVDDELVQGSAFMLKGDRLVTAAHVFVKAGSEKYCFVYRIGSPGERFKAMLVAIDLNSDIAVLKILENDKITSPLPFLKYAKELNPSAGYLVSIIGFPQLLPGHNSISVVPSRVVSTYTRSMMRYAEVNVEIKSGNSGGPVVNAYMQVVGMIVQGTSATLVKEDGRDRIELEGQNAFLSASHFTSKKLDELECQYSFSYIQVIFY